MKKNRYCIRTKRYSSNASTLFHFFLYRKTSSCNMRSVISKQLCDCVTCILSRRRQWEWMFLTQICHSHFQAILMQLCGVKSSMHKRSKIPRWIFLRAWHAIKNESRLNFLNLILRHSLTKNVQRHHYIIRAIVTTMFHYSPILLPITNRFGITI